LILGGDDNGMSRSGTTGPGESTKALTQRVHCCAFRDQVIEIKVCTDLDALR
jgi:hypothetical protein